MPSATAKNGNALLTNSPAKKEATVTTTSAATGAAIGYLRRMNSGRQTPNEIRTSSQGGPSAPFGSGALTEIESRPISAAQMSASIQNLRARDDSCFTRA